MFTFEYTVVNLEGTAVLTKLDNGQFRWSTDSKAAFTFTESGAYAFRQHVLEGDGSVFHVDNVRLRSSWPVTPSDNANEHAARAYGFFGG